MSINVFTADAPVVAQVDTVTPGGTIEASDLFSMTLTEEDGSTTHVLSVAAGGTTVGAVCNAIVAAWNASTDALVSTLTAALVGTSPNGTAVTLTADTAGVPFYLTVGTTETGGGAADDQTFARAATIASSGPSDLGAADNWSLGYVPTDGGGHAGDSVVIPASASASILYGLDWTGLSLTGAVTIERGFSGLIGSRTAPWRIVTTGLITWSSGATQFLDVRTSSGIRILYAASASDGQYTANLIGVDNDALWIDAGGSVGVGAGAGSIFEADAVTILGGGVALGGGVVKKDGATAVPLTMSGGTVTADCPLGAVVKSGGDLTITGSGAVASIRGTGGGTVHYQTSGTLTLWNGADASGITFAGNPGCTVTAAFKRSIQSALLDPQGVVTWTNPPELPYTRINDPCLDLGTHIKLTVAAAT